MQNADLSLECRMEMCEEWVVASEGQYTAFNERGLNIIILQYHVFL